MIRRCSLSMCLVFVLGWAAIAQAQQSFSGTWDTTFGPMHLFQEKDQITGFYQSAGAFNKIEGQVEKARWTFTYQEPMVRGEGRFDLAPNGQTIVGQWRPLGAEAWFPWTGKRRAPREAKGTFDGVWSSSFGRMRLQTDKDQASGCYAFPYGASLSGKLADGRFTFEYREPQARGEGWFVLSDDGRAFRGLWRPAGVEEWSDWFGTRVEPVPGRTWLVVVEAHWEHDLAEPEYSFGAMLRTFFARAPGVEVRHRYINSGQDLAAACHEVTYLTEPVVLVVSSHGTGAGITVRGETVGAKVFAEALKHAPNIQLLHFSSCSVMGDRLPADIQSTRANGRQFPISGYTQPVDWAGSAVLEFLYFDMILARRLPPAKAAEQVRLLLPFSGDEPIAKAIIPPTGFRLLSPK